LLDANGRVLALAGDELQEDLLRKDSPRVVNKESDMLAFLGPPDKRTSFRNGPVLIWDSHPRCGSDETR